MRRYARLPRDRASRRRIARSRVRCVGSASAPPPLQQSERGLRGVVMLEDTLDRPVVNETNLQGGYDFHLKTEGEDFLEQLRTKLGLAITPASRTVEVLQVTPR